MSRVKRGVCSNKKHKKLLKTTKGFYGRSKCCIKSALQARSKSLQYSYVSRKLKKRFFKGKRLKAINNLLEGYFLSYSKFKFLIKCFNWNSNVILKILSFSTLSSALLSILLLDSFYNDK